MIEEPQPRWLAFLNNEMDFLERLPNEFANVATPNNVLAANLKKRGIQMERTPGMEITYSYFGDEGPGGGRLRAGEGGASPRHRAGPGRRHRDPHPAEEPGHRARTVPSAPAPWATTRISAPRPRSTTRPRRRRCSTCTGTSTATATAGATCREPDASGRMPALHHRVRFRARRAAEAARRELEEEHGRHRHQHDVQEGQVARPAQGVHRRKAADVGPGLECRDPRRRRLLRDALRPQRRAGEPFALQPARIRSPLRAGQAPSRRRPSETPSTAR